MFSLTYDRWIMFLACLSLVIVTSYAGAHLILPTEDPNGSSASFMEEMFAPPTSFLSAIGRFHFIFLHFPIALIVMTVAAELCWIWFGNALFTHAARFMLLAAAAFALPTALLGWALGSGQHYEGVSLDLYAWHRYFGFMTAALAIVTAVLRERCVHEKTSSVFGYYFSLFLLFLSVSLTGAFGGSLAFGFGVW